MWFVLEVAFMLPLQVHNIMNITTAYSDSQWATFWVPPAYKATSLWVHIHLKDYIWGSFQVHFCYYSPWIAMFAWMTCMLSKNTPFAYAGITLTNTYLIWYRVLCSVVDDVGQIIIKIPFVKIVRSAGQDDNHCK